MLEKKTIMVLQYASHIRRNKCQLEQLKSLGLGQINKKKVLPDSEAVRALICKLSHMVKIISDDEKGTN